MADAINDAGADQQVGSYVDRDKGRIRRDRLWDELSTPKGCVDYCVERCAPFVNRRGPLQAKLFYQAGRILGKSGDVARGMIQTTIRRGGFENVQKWLAEPPALVPWQIPGPTLDQFGFVYTAELVRLPHVLKIGFSQDPDRRIKELECKFGEPFKLIAADVGTLLDEAHAHCIAGRRYIGREFVFAPDFTDVRPGRIPAFLAGPFSGLSED